ncbi:MAG: alpha-E domain-containing protein [Steroidobacteraceae bacterium]
MLSRVADNLYWLARYLERVENLARLVEVSTSLMLDLPRHLAPGWQPLITISGSEAAFGSQDRDYSEKTVVRFVVADAKNPGSMVSSMAGAREIARTVRDILPREVWEQINELNLYVREHAEEATSKRTRHAFLAQVSRGVQSLTGMFEGMVSDGDALSFIKLGRNFERADMTSRIVDVRAAAMMSGGRDAELRPFETVLWMSVLRSLSGYQMYRINTRERVYGAGVVRFLLADENFPRACVCCLLHAEEVLRALPNSSALQRRLARMRQAVTHTRFESLGQAELHGFIDRLQRSLARANDEVTRLYFLGESRPGQTQTLGTGMIQTQAGAQSQGA